MQNSHEKGTLLELSIGKQGCLIEGFCCPFVGGGKGRAVKVRK